MPEQPPVDNLATRHIDRARAESFGAVADQYDLLRAPYPEALMDQLASLRPAETLDIGCGTGKVAAALAARGLSVLGVEPDDRMAELARSRGVPIEVATFEAWADQGRQFDLITCGNAWHWVDGALGFPKLAKLLRPGGAFALFWAGDRLDLAMATEFTPVYRAHASEIPVFGDPTPRPSFDPFAGVSLFASVEFTSFPAERSLSAEEWVGLMATVSDHQRLGPKRLARLQEGIRETIEGLGGVVHVQSPTHLWLARRAT